MRHMAVFVALDAGDPTLAPHPADDARTGEPPSAVPAPVRSALAVTGRP